MQIIKLHWQDTLAIRQEVLWPDKPQEFCHVEGDQDAWHYGVIAEGNNNKKLVCVASIYFEVVESNNKNQSKNNARLRKFATLDTYQKQSIGSFLINHIINSLKEHNVSYLWCDARETALEFYKRFGFATDSSRFFKSDIPYFKMHMQNA